MFLPGRFALSVVLLSGVVRADDAGVLFADDAETGALLTTDVPGGRWTAVERVTTGNVFRVIPTAAHRGDGGVRFSDAFAGTGTTSDGRVFANFTGQTDLYARAWTRINRSSDGGYVNVFVLGSASGGFHAEAVLEEGSTALGGHDQAAGYDYTSFPFDVGDGNWHLVELGLEGNGTATARRTLWVDGLERATQSPADLRTVDVSRIYFGVVHGELRFTGTLDADDVRVSTGPPASTLTLGSVVGGVCAQFAVGLRASGDAGGVVAPYDVVVDVRGDGGASAVRFFSDVTCTTQVTQLRIVTGERSTIGSAQLESGDMLSLVAAHPDFLPAFATIPISPSGPWDAGPDGDGGVQADGGAGPGFFGVGCSCGSSGDLFWFVGLVLVRGRKRPWKHLQRDAAHQRLGATLFDEVHQGVDQRSAFLFGGKGGGHSAEAYLQRAFAHSARSPLRHRAPDDYAPLSDDVALRFPRSSGLVGLCDRAADGERAGGRGPAGRRSECARRRRPGARSRGL